MASKLLGSIGTKVIERNFQKHIGSRGLIEGLFRECLAVLQDPLHSEIEERFKAIGQTEDARGVLIVFTLRRHDAKMLIRPVSARYVHWKEVEYYEAIARA